MKERNLKESRVKESDVKGSKINDSKINDSKINDSKINDSKINDSYINESCWKVRFYQVGSFLILLFWMIMIFGMSSKTGEQSAGLSFKIAKWFYSTPFRSIMKFDSFHTLIRKCAHFTEYGILGLLLVNFIHSCGIKWNRRVLIFTCLFCFIYAALDEYHQSFVDGRGPSIRDVLIDTTGTIAFQGFILLFAGKRDICK
ncbi:MAG: VanZ family protein [Lachnospiraceae bacterium]|nr:VanZ family protein [Lachnospiraceae bacterium]